jgi:hypothetical protein
MEYKYFLPIMRCYYYYLLLLLLRSLMISTYPILFG